MSLHMTCVMTQATLEALGRPPGSLGPLAWGTSCHVVRTLKLSCGVERPRDEELSSLVTLVLTGQAASGLSAATKENPGHVLLAGLPSYFSW